MKKFCNRPLFFVSLGMLCLFSLISLDYKTFGDQLWQHTGDVKIKPKALASISDNNAMPMEKAGFHPIWVYTGKGSTKLPLGPKWHSQVGQDKIVFDFLGGKKNGYFIDLAANHAVSLSNTLGLERDHDWSGLCIEPNPMYWELLSHRKCDVVAAVVGASTNEEVSFAFNIWKGGIIGKDFDNKNKKDKTAAKVKTTNRTKFQEFKF